MGRGEGVGARQGRWGGTEQDGAGRVGLGWVRLGWGRVGWGRVSWEWARRGGVGRSGQNREGSTSLNHRGVHFQWERSRERICGFFSPRKDLGSDWVDLTKISPI